jgi:alpha-tubulin suppressor-like RCC1 family protein
VLLNELGKIYLAGSLLFNKIGIDSQTNNFREFKLHQQMSQYVVTKVACGDYHTLALIEDGTVFSWGGTLWDKTGHKGGGVNRMEKLVGQHIVEVACGDFHSVALNSVGQIYSWGGGSQNKNKGQLGHSNKKDVPHPEEIKFFKDEKVEKIACGDYHTMVITQAGELFAFGEGNMGQLGTGGKEDCATPKKVKLNFELALEDYFRSDITKETRVEQMSLGGHHSLFLTNKGHVYACGYGSQGQLGLGQGHTDNRYEPILVKSLLGKEIVMVSAGATHSLVLSSNHDVYSCGYNAKGQLGLGEDKTATLWTHITQLSGKNVGKIYAGGDHSWAVIDELTPFIKNYEMPSPIRVTLDEPTMVKALESMHPDKSGISNSSMDEILVSLTPQRKLELIMTDVEMSHRFIHFSVKENYPNLKSKIEEYISFVYDN